MSALKTPIDFKGLEEELHAALAADELYKLQNDAKLRAVEQNVPTYEHFRQMVNGAHLKPLDRNDMKPKIGVHWNPTTSSIRPVMPTISEKLNYNTENNEDIKTEPKTCEAFLRSWRTIADYSERFIYVWSLRNILRTHIFRVEIPESFLNTFIDVCIQYLSNVDDVTSIIDLLSILSSCNRFNLTICFMRKEKQFKCEQLFQQLRLKGKSRNELSEDEIETLAVKYGVKFN